MQSIWKCYLTKSHDFIGLGRLTINKKPAVNCSVMHVINFNLFPLLRFVFFQSTHISDSQEENFKWGLFRFTWIRSLHYDLAHFSFLFMPFLGWSSLSQ